MYVNAIQMDRLNFHRIILTNNKDYVSPIHEEGELLLNCCLILWTQPSPIISWPTRML